MARSSVWQETCRADFGLYASEPGRMPANNSPIMKPAMLWDGLHTVTGEWPSEDPDLAWEHPCRFAGPRQ